MHRLLGRFVVLLGLVTVLGWTGQARADELPPAPPPPRDIVVLEVAESAASLEVEPLSAALAEELQAIVVTPDDPRASAAKGTLHVEAASPRRGLKITYTARSRPTTRSVSWPDDPAAARRQTVLVAGNLARDEGSELARELAKKKQEATAPPASPASAPSSLRSGNAYAALRYYADTDARNRKLVLGTTLVLTAGAVGAGVGVYATGDRTVGAGLMIGGGIGAAVTLISYALAPRSAFEKLLDEGPAPQDYEQAWARAAAREHDGRPGEAILSFVVAGLNGATGTLDLASRSTGLAILYYSGAAVFLGTGVWTLLTEGPVEAAWHLYEKSTGRTATPSAETATLRPRFGAAPIAGGVMAQMALTF
jgi:hypothetical protein